MRILLVSLLVLALAGPAAAAVPRIDVQLAPGSGYARIVVVRLTRAGKPVRGAAVIALAAMRAPGHSMTVPAVTLRQRGAGVYKGTLRFLMLGRWKITVVADAGALGKARAVRAFTL
jgi:hypothetical protein